MSRNELPFSMSGNLTADPELRFTPSGAPVVSFTLAFTPRRFNRDTGEWIDGETTFMSCTAWRQLAEHVAETLTRGSRAMVSGQLVTETWEDKDTGAKRSAVKLVCDEAGASLLYATARINKVTRSNGPDPVDPYTGEVASSKTHPASSSN